MLSCPLIEWSSLLTVEVTSYIMLKYKIYFLITIGKNIIQLVVPGVNLSYLKRPYDSIFVSVIQNLCVVDQLQSFGPKFELLVCSSAYPVSSTDSSSTIHRSDILSEQSTETLSSLTPLLYLSVSILTPFSPKRRDFDKRSSSRSTSNLQLVSIKCSGLDVLGKYVLLCVIVCVWCVHACPCVRVMPCMHVFHLLSTCSIV